MEEFFAYIVKNLVDQPDAVEVRCSQSDRGIVVEVRVDANDVGKVVGRQGRTIEALRTIASTIGARLGHRLRLEVVQ
ncbi:MAG: KH domain-containing protein [Chlamydiia bacterium]|nr:KH domain-containing protein [Chlamydiia bacterium]